jgi:hypothetical protein
MSYSGDPFAQVACIADYYRLRSLEVLDPRFHILGEFLEQVSRLVLTADRVDNSDVAPDELDPVLAKFVPDFAERVPEAFAAMAAEIEAWDEADIARGEKEFLGNCFGKNPIKAVRKAQKYLAKNPNPQGLWAE